VTRVGSKAPRPRKKAAASRPRPRRAAAGDEVAELRARLEEAEETLEAIRTGEVDALIVSRGGGEALYTLKGADRSYRIFMEEMSEGAATLTPSGLCTYCNRRLAGMLRQPVSRIVGSPLEEFVAREQRAAFSAHLAGTGHERTKREFTFVRPEGTPFYALVSVTASEMDGAVTLCLIVTDLSFEPLFSIGRDGVVKDANAAAEVVTGIPRERLIGTDFCGTFAEPAKAREWFLDVLEERQARDCPLAIRHSSGRTTDVVFNANVGTGEDGTALGVIAVARDVTERRREEQGFRSLNAELEDAVRSMESFSYSVAHDLRAPIRAIDGFSAMLDRDHGRNLGEEGRRLLATVRENARRMGLLIDDLLRFSRTGRAELKLAPVETEKIVREVLAEVLAGSRKEAVRVEVADLPSVNADAALLKVVLRNLLENALKFSSRRDHPRIVIGSRKGRNGPEFFVRDNGVGFDAKYLGKLFGVFQRLHSTNEFEGTGIGLALVKRIVERHGGRAWAEGEVDRGATFWFTLGPTRGDSFVPEPPEEGPP
jgi:PAS domain S-box-containing protein